MNREQASTLIKQTFTHAFDKDRFRNFAFNFLNHVDEGKAQRWNKQYIKDAFKPHVIRYERLGSYTSPESEKLDVLIVNLASESKLERARTAIRNFVADYLQKRDEKDAALVAYVSPSERQWRFSYVKMEYATIENESGKIGVESRLTPARRFSYIVGEGESCHTAQTRFLNLLQDTETDPTLTDIEEAFSVEAVTKEFFTNYADLFSNINSALEQIVAKDKVVRTEFKSKNVNTVDFAKKLMGQIVFLYFLQKKGWLGVAEGQDWGTGPRDFLRKLAASEYGQYENFFNDVLEPLFYDTLATDRGHDAWCNHFNCRIPFLNGGLFEPLDDYDWKKTDIILPNKLFINSEFVEQGITGTGILDVFDRYNFTVNEAEPLEKEVAIDPEMLGKVFENLIEDNRRKGLGAYYTPREIVHYMCQESLINYLDSALNKDTLSCPRDDIEIFVHIGDQISHYEAVEATYDFKMPKSIKKHARLLDEALAAITICDPAVGSGAFPVGMMHEIISTRCALTPYFNDVHDRTPYQFKRHAIQNCIYGVDIDPGAVEIAKLRLWLSLVVDEEDVKQIKPLPNLDYKIVVGNSLLGVEKTLENLSIFRDLERLKPLFFDEPDHNRKLRYKAAIEEAIHSITHNKSLFDFKVYFSEVFYISGGFDVIITNPPYLKERNNKGIFDVVASSQVGMKYHEGKMDYWYYFLHRALDISHDAGTISFITSRYWIQSAGSKKLIRRLRTSTAFVSILDIGDLTVFENVAGHHMVHIYSRKTTDRLCTIRRLKNTLDDLTKEYDTPNLQIFQKNSSSLFHDNQIYVQATRLILSVDRKLSDYFLVSQGVVQNPDKVSRVASRKFGLQKGEGVFVLTQSEFDALSLSASEKEFVKPFYDEVAIQRYHLLVKEYCYLIYLTKKNCFSLRGKPKIASHLSKYRKIMEQRRETKKGTIEWFHLHWPRNPDYFESEKVILPSMFRKPRAAYVPERAYVGLGSNVVIPKSQKSSLKSLVAVLNSRMASAWFHTNGKHRGVGVDIGVEKLRSFPFPDIQIDHQNRLVEFIDKILVAKQQDVDADTTALESKIDRLVYKLYDLTPSEIKMVEESVAR